MYIVGINTTADTVLIYDANYDNHCRVRYESISYSDFLSDMEYIWFCCNADGRFISYI